MKNKEVVFELILLFILSFFFIFYKFNSIPRYLAFDEIEFTKLALSLDGKPYTPYSLLATGHSTLYFYIILLSLKTFGVNIFALRLPSAVFGILSVIVFYLTIRIIFKQYNNKTIKQFLPFLLTLVFLTSRWFINFSRFSFEPTLLLFLELTSIYFLLKSFETKKWNYLIFSGIFAGLAFNSYTPGRFFFIVTLALIFFKNIKSLNLKQFNFVLVKKVLHFIIPFVIVITPLIYQLSIIKDTRIDQLFFWRNHEMTISEKINGTWQNVSSLTLMFFVKGDMNGRHNYPGKPALNPILALLFVIGLITALKQYKDNYNKLFLIYFFISIIPSIPIYPWENPSMLRTFTVIPTIVYFVGQGIILVINQVKKFNNTSYIITAMTIVILFSSFYELRTYFKYQAKVFDSSFEIKYPLNKAIKMKNVYEKMD